MRRILAALAVAALAAGSMANTAVADDSTTGVIRFVVGTPPGGALDPYARVIADKMKQELGQTSSSRTSRARTATSPRTRSCRRRPTVSRSGSAPNR